MRLRALGEFNFINRVARYIKVSRRVVRGIGDDAAVLRYNKDRYLLFTTDLLVEGRHFRKTAGGYLIGKKSLSASISDIAAMGGEPNFALVSLGVSGRCGLRFTDALYKGIRDVSRRFKVDVVGGDTVNTDKIIVNIALLGNVEKENLVLRGGAQSNDAIFVTGTIGGAREGKHLNFTPRVREARYLVQNFRVHSMIDISDGLIADLGHILKSSKKGAILCETKIPLSKIASDFDFAIREGEDFELIFTLPPGDSERLLRRWPFKTPLSRVGQVLDKDRGLYLLRKDNRREKIQPEGYAHF